jgi:uncharacterized protein (DUF169 family)
MAQQVIMEMETYERLRASHEAMKGGLVMVRESTIDYNIYNGCKTTTKYFCITNDELVTAMRLQHKEEIESLLKTIREKKDEIENLKTASVFKFIKTKWFQ